MKMKWEYKIIQLPMIVPILREDTKEKRHDGFSKWESELNELGEKGWELIFCTNEGVCFFKRVEDDFLNYSLPKGNTKK